MCPVEQRDPDRREWYLPWLVELLAEPDRARIPRLVGGLRDGLGQIAAAVAVGARERAGHEVLSDRCPAPNGH